MKFAVFIDYDNLRNDQKAGGVYQIVSKTFFRVLAKSDGFHGICEVRVYGGWFEEIDMTKQALEVSAELQKEFPKIIRLPGADGNDITLRTIADLAQSLMEDPGHGLFNTYRKKGKPTNIRVQSPDNIGCSITECPLPLTKKLLKSGKCPNPSCSLSRNDLVYRHEQKTVDTMLTCDLIYAIDNFERIILVSSDDDFLPAIRIALKRGASVFRFHPNTNSQRTPLSLGGLKLLEFDL